MKFFFVARSTERFRRDIYESFEHIFRYKEKKINFLFSYYYFRNTNIEHVVNRLDKAGIKYEFFLDSGAYSANSKEKTLNNKAYINWANRYESFFKYVSVLDVIGSEEKTLDNTCEMYDTFKNPSKIIPCFHIGDNEEYLERYKLLSKYISIGGVVPYAMRVDYISKWLKVVMKSLENHYVHGFGVTGQRLLRMFPWSSVDSSSWNTFFMSGRLNLFDEDLGKWVGGDLRHPETMISMKYLCESYGFRLDECMNASDNWLKMQGVSMLAWLRYIDWINKTTVKKHHDD
jgi:hypothetical protein